MHERVGVRRVQRLTADTSEHTGTVGVVAVPAAGRIVQQTVGPMSERGVVRLIYSTDLFAKNDELDNTGMLAFVSQYLKILNRERK